MDNSMNSFQQVGFSFELLQNALIYLHTPLLLPSFSNLGTIFAQIFLNDPPYPLIIHIQLTCYHSSSKTAIALHLFSHMLNVYFCSAYGWPPTPVIIFYLLSSLFEPPMPLKKMSSWLNFHKTVTKSALTEKRAKKSVVVTECWNLVFKIIRHCDIIESNAFSSAIKVFHAVCTVPLIFKHVSYT